MTLPPVRKSVIVPLSQGDAFDLFTRRMAEWWPLESHSVGLVKAASVRFEPRVGGRIVEQLADGSEAIWGTVGVWDEPRRVMFSWHAGTTESEATEVEVTFTPEGDGTRVDLEHRGWESRGAKAREIREGYEGGWDEVLARLVARARPA